MLNHALALAEDGAQVSLVGYVETSVDREVTEHPSIRVCRIRPLPRAPEGASRLRFLAVSAIRVGWLHFQTLWALLARTPRADVVLIQNPPSIPTLLAAWFVSRIRGSLLVVDWHNFGYAMLALRLQPQHLVVRLSQAWERWLGRKADAHFCVSAAMQTKLVEEFGLESSVVLLDKPRRMQSRRPISSRYELARRILDRAGLDLQDNAALVMCPTSWTADEDMDLLFEALRRWDSAPSISTRPRLYVLVTGQGPMREQYEARLSSERWRHVEVHTAFLDPADYRELLGAALIGVCMHRSSSGVDLPMKLVDLLSARTPVCVLDYGDCLTEQIQPGFNAVLFRTGEELAHRFDELLQGFPGELPALQRLQHNIDATYTETWQQVWSREAAPVLRSLAGLA
jgi:beta-1,4-mannosyltransferase